MQTTACRPIRCLRSPRVGATALELALVLPLLIVLCLTSVDFGRFAHAYIAVSNASRAGSEYGATRRYEPSLAALWQQRLIETVREDFGAVGGIEPGQLEVQVWTDDDAYGLTRVSVTAAYPFMTTVSWPMIPRPLVLSRTVVFRRFR
jgi:hypothetical protein